MTITKSLTTSLITGLTRSLRTGDLVLPVTSGLELQLTAFQKGKTKSQLVTVDEAGKVATWFDLSGNGKNATQGTSVSQPTFATTGISGKPVLDYKLATNIFMVFSDIALTNGTAICVFVNTETTASGFILARTANNQLLRFDPDIPTANGSLRNYDGTAEINFPFTSSQKNVPMIIRSEFEEGVGKRIFSNGDLKVSGTYDDNIVANQIGRLQSLTSENMGGLLGEILIYSRILSASEILSVEYGYLSPKWGISI